jgi:hypothetical protein
MTLVSSANITGSVKVIIVFIVGGRSYVRAGQIFFGSRNQAKNLGARLMTNKKIKPENTVGTI